MRDIRLFRKNKGKMEELEAKDGTDFHELLKENLIHIFGIKILMIDYSTGTIDNGNIDIIGYDENNCPVIILYKDSLKDNLIIKGVYYIDWILDHRGDFEMQFNKNNESYEINWSGLRLICISHSFTKYDIYASKAIKKNIELVKYREYNDLLYFEIVNPVKELITDKSDNMLKNYSIVKNMNDKVLNNYLYLRTLISSLGDDIQEIFKKDCIVYKTIRNFASITYNEAKGKDSLYINLNINDHNLELDGEFIRDVSKIDHFGSGNIEIKIKNSDDVEKSLKYIKISYNKN